MQAEVGDGVFLFPTADEISGVAPDWLFLVPWFPLTHSGGGVQVSGEK